MFLMHFCSMPKVLWAILHLEPTTLYSKAHTKFGLVRGLLIPSLLRKKQQCWGCGSMKTLEKTWWHHETDHFKNLNENTNCDKRVEAAWGKVMIVIWAEKGGQCQAGDCSTRLLCFCHEAQAHLSPAGEINLTDDVAEWSRQREALDPPEPKTRSRFLLMNYKVS